MKQNISATKERTYKLRIRLTGPDGKPHVMTSGEKLIFGVKKTLSDANYVLNKTISYPAGFEAVAVDTIYEPNKYYLRTAPSGIITHTLVTSADEPIDWPVNYYSNDGLYNVTINTSDTEHMTADITYFYDVGLQSGDSYYSVIDTSKFYLSGNVTKKET